MPSSFLDINSIQHAPTQTPFYDSTSNRTDKVTGNVDLQTAAIATKITTATRDFPFTQQQKHYYIYRQ